jgi:hypothetical protein
MLPGRSLMSSRSTNFCVTCSVAAPLCSPSIRSPAPRRAARSTVALTAKPTRPNGRPYTHSEALADQERCCDLCRAAGDKHTLKYALLHADVIHRFGRFPHRNAVLGRGTAPEEQAFLDGGGFTG